MPDPQMLEHAPAKGPTLAAAVLLWPIAVWAHVASGLVHALGIGIGLIRRRDCGDLLLRGASSLVLASGLLFLWSALA